MEINADEVISDIDRLADLDRKILLALEKNEKEGKNPPHELYTFLVRLDGRVRKAEKYLEKLKKREENESKSN